MRNVPAPDGEKILQIIPQNYIIDDKEETANPVGTFGNKLASTFNIILGDTVAINRLEMALKRVNIAPLGLYLNAIASGEAVLTPDRKEGGRWPSSTSAAEQPTSSSTKTTSSDT